MFPCHLSPRLNRGWGRGLSLKLRSDDCSGFAMLSSSTRVRRGVWPHTFLSPSGVLSPRGRCTRLDMHMKRVDWKAGLPKLATKPNQGWMYTVAHAAIPASPG